MTREEFIARQEMAKQQCQSMTCRILCGIYLAMPVALVLLGVFLCGFFFTPARTTILYLIGSCVLLYVCVLVIYQRWTGKLKKLGMYCPSCKKWLDLSVTQTGKCSCGQRVAFDD